MAPWPRRLSLVFFVIGLSGVGAAGDTLGHHQGTPGAAGPSALATFPQSKLQIKTAAGKSHGFRVEVAATAKRRAQGLMFRRLLAADAGMLFDYGREMSVSMWMKNTLLPLDILFISADGTIVNIAQRTVPGSLAPIPSARPVRGVLEINAGTSSRLGLRPGDMVRHPIFAKK